MKKLFFKLTCTFVLFFCLLYQTFGQLPCNNWLNVNGSALRSGVEIGDLDISGDKLTVEAQVNANYIDPRYYGGDIVSKHQDPFACNYLLRGERAEITTSAGYYATPPVCGLELNKTYHIAMVYDGSYLKYYRNGFLMSQVSCTGNVILNNWQTLIGATAGTESTLFTGFYGYINEVRIWNVARTQNEIKQYMDKSLPNPATQTGLLAYYTFDDLLNKQGNAVWDGALISPATINQANPQCSFVADSCKVVNVSAAFSAPDTVCVDSTLKVTNTSTGATTYNWSFCAPTVNAPVSGMNMGSFGGAINDPVFQDIAKDDNGNFYGLVAQHYPATIVRLNYGNSLLNTPTVENLGNFGGAIPNQTEGIKIIKEGNTWYAFVVGGNNELPNSSPRIVKLDFGNSLANNAVATNWGNISNSLNFPTELFIAKESGNYYGYTLNLADNSLVRINFGNNFSSAPTAINLGNPGNYFDYPTGFDFVNENGNWYCFEINELSENLIRLDFGNSLLNSPSAVNLGNPGNNFIRPRDVAIINTCSGIFGYVVNGHGAPINGSLVQLDFGTDILSTPGAVNLGDPAGFRLPHSFTHFFHIDNDMYTFIQNNDGNSIIRLKFSGCANATPSSSILQNPPPVKYSSPGLYNIILTVDIGLPTETSACKQIEVKDCAPPIVADFTITDTVCVDSTLKIKNTSSGATTYNWSFCAPDTNAPLTGTNLGNISSVLSNPVFQDIVKGDDGNYYGFMTNHNPGTLIRLDYGNSLLNTPTAITLGNFGDVIPNQAEGIQVIKEGGNWYAIIVGGGNTGVNSSPRIIKLDFGSLITNTSPTATNWGNIGSMQFPHGLAIHKDGDRYYGFAVDAFCNCIIKFDFGNNFSSPPAGTNFGNVGNLSTPSGIYFVNNSGSWYAFVTNRTSNSLTRLSFGTSLSNTPTGINIGNPGNTLIVPGDIIINNTCSGIFGYVVNAQGPPGNGSIVKLDFGTDILNTPAATNQGDAGNFSFPHSFTSLFYEGNDLYTFIPNAGNNTLSRVKISGCTNASPSSSILQNPPPVKYSSPGLYNIILTVDIGLPTETSACKQIEVKDCFNPCTGFTIDAGKDTTICPGTSVQLNATGASAFHWNRSPYLSDTTIANPIASPLVTTNFIVRGSDNLGCNASDTVKVIVRPRPAFTLTNDTTICSGSSAQLNAAGTGISAYSWVPPTGLSSTNISNPVANPKDTTEYFVTVTDGNGCTNTDSVMVNVAPLPTVSTINDTTICPGTSVTLATTGSNSNTYNWTPTGSLNNAGIKNPVASPKSQTKYIVTAATATGCKSKDSVTVSLFPAATITASNDTTICHDTQAQLYASGGTGYAWSPPGSLSNAGIANPVANPDATTNYIVTVTDINTCAYKDTVKVAVIEKAQFSVTPDQSVCPSQSATVSATGGGTYQWEPASAFSNPLLQTQVVTPSVTTVYTVHINANNFCEDTAVKSTTVAIRPNANIGSRKDNDIDCIHTNTYLYAAGASVYEWSPATALDDATKANPLCTATATTTYIVKGTTAEGCVGYDTITVYVTADGGDIFQMPSAFTPNGDGLNDCFGVSKWGDITNLQFEIFNKWGNLVFRTGNPSECWNGSYKGMPQPSGVYVYWVRAASKFCGNIFRKGTIVLIR